MAGWSQFVQAAWDHERQHFEHAEAVLKQPGNNIYLEIEKIVRSTEFNAVGSAPNVYDSIQNAAKTAGDVDPAGNWATQFWLWKSLTENIFLPSVPGFPF